MICLEFINLIDQFKVPILCIIDFIYSLSILYWVDTTLVFIFLYSSYFIFDFLFLSSFLKKLRALIFTMSFFSNINKTVNVLLITSSVVNQTFGMMCYFVNQFKIFYNFPSDSFFIHMLFKRRYCPVQEDSVLKYLRLSDSSKRHPGSKGHRWEFLPRQYSTK